MTTKLKSADIVIVGLGWTGGILAKELADTGLSIVVARTRCAARHKSGFHVSDGAR